MRLLILAAALLVLSAGLAGCKSHGPLTPEEAFQALKTAYSRSDAEGVERLLSRGSREKIMGIIKLIGGMEEDQRNALAKRFEISSEKLGRLSVRDYLALQMETGKREGRDYIPEVIQYKVTGISIKGDHSSVKVENGLDLHFVREGPYWKFDMD